MNLLKNEHAAEMSEVGLVLAAVVVVAIAAFQTLGGNITDTVEEVASAITGG